MEHGYILALRRTAVLGDPAIEFARGAPCRERPNISSIAANGCAPRFWGRMTASSRPRASSSASPPPRRSRGEILTAAFAGLAAGAMSMAAGEYVSVSSQADSEAADLEREKRALRREAEGGSERTDADLRRIAASPRRWRGRSRELMAKDALSAHARDELGFAEGARAKPMLGGLRFRRCLFALGAALPPLAAFLAPHEDRSSSPSRPRPSSFSPRSARSVPGWAAPALSSRRSGSPSGALRHGGDGGHRGAYRQGRLAHFPRPSRRAVLFFSPRRANVLWQPLGGPPHERDAADREIRLVRIYGRRPQGRGRFLHPCPRLDGAGRRDDRLRISGRLGRRDAGRRNDGHSRRRQGDGGEALVDGLRLGRERRRRAAEADGGRRQGVQGAVRHSRASAASPSSPTPTAEPSCSSATRTAIRRRPRRRARPARVGWHELHADDGAKAFAFYSDFFGWNKDGEFDMGPIGVYHLFNTRHGEQGGIMTRMPQTPTAFWLYYFNVDGADAAAERITAHGGQIINGPHEVPGGQWIVQAHDPQGAMFAAGGAEAVSQAPDHGGMRGDDRFREASTGRKTENRLSPARFRSAKDLCFQLVPKKRSRAAREKEQETITGPYQGGIRP